MWWPITFMTQQRGCKYREQKLPLPPPPLQGLNWKSYHIEILMIVGGGGGGWGWQVDTTILIYQI